MADDYRYLCTYSYHTIKLDIFVFFISFINVHLILKIKSENGECVLLFMNELGIFGVADCELFSEIRNSKWQIQQVISLQA